MVAITNIALFALGATASVIKRSTPTDVLNDLKTTNTDTQALTTAINNYDGTIGGVAPIQQKTNVVLADIKQATTDTNNSAQASDADSNSIISYINNTLEPSIKAATTAIVNQKPKFVSAGTTAIVKQNIAYLKGNATALSSALVVKASASYKAAASSVSSKVIADINSASAAYP